MVGTVVVDDSVVGTVEGAGADTARIPDGECLATTTASVTKRTTALAARTTMRRSTRGGYRSRLGARPRPGKRNRRGSVVLVLA